MNISVICEPFFRSSGTGWIFLNISVICEPLSGPVIFLNISVICEPFSGPVHSLCRNIDSIYLMVFIWKLTWLTLCCVLTGSIIPAEYRCAHEHITTNTLLFSCPQIHQCIAIGTAFKRAYTSYDNSYISVLGGLSVLDVMSEHSCAQKF